MKTITVEEHFVSPGFLAGPGKNFITQLSGRGPRGVRMAEHLQEVTLPMLFLQGTKDALAELRLLQDVVANLGDRATLRLVDDADHAADFFTRPASGMAVR